MTAITTTHNNWLTVQQNDHPLLQPPISQVEDEEIFNAVKMGVIKAVADLNHKKIEKEDYLINELTDNIKLKFAGIRVSEIILAFHMGIRGEFGEYFGLNVVTFEKFIKSYLESNHRLELGKTLPAIAAPQKEKVLTREDRINFAKAAFDKFKFRDDYNDLGNIVYDFLDREGLIKFTTKEKFDVMNTIRQREYQRLSSPISTREKAQFEKQIQKMIDSNDSIIPAAKRECLRMFFSKLKESGQELVFDGEPIEGNPLSNSNLTKSVSIEEKGSNHA